MVDELFGSLREERDAVTALTAAREVLAGLLDDQDEQRRLLAERHGKDFSLAELDAEVGYKKLVTVLGGGGGAGLGLDHAALHHRRSSIARRRRSSSTRMD